LISSFDTVEPKKHAEAAEDNAADAENDAGIAQGELLTELKMLK
jgi:hypothetical protein